MDALETFRLLAFCADVIVTGIAAWLLACHARHTGHGVLEAGLAWLWSATALVTGTGVVLGLVGGFGPTGFFISHVLLCALLAWVRRPLLRSDWAEARQALRRGAEAWQALGALRALAAGLVIVLIGLVGIAALARPAVYDALTYHLPRIGHWLQEGRIRIINTPDARLNFVADLPDIAMAWLLGGTAEGFRLVVLAQAVGGVMAFGATAGLARLTGLAPGAALLAGALLLGMANVAGQFTAAQTDLFTAGVFAAAFYLWVCALRRGHAPVLGAIGAGLALGAKGTLFYLAPGALLWTAWLAWRHRLTARQAWWSVGGALAGVAVFAGPAFVRNFQAYGDPLGPAEWVRKHHRGYEPPARLWHKLELNLASSLAQNLEPQSQPWGLRTLTRDAATAIVQRLPARDDYTLDGLDRRETLRSSILQRTTPDADVISFGLVTALLFGGGALAGLARWRTAEGRLVLVWSAGVAAFVVFFHGMQQWHPYAFRYLVLAAPWIAVVAAWGVEQLRRPLRIGVWALALAGAANITWHVTTQTHQAGWRSVVAPAQSRAYFVAQGWRDWSQALDRADAPFVLMLGEELPLAAFYRQPTPRRVDYLPYQPEQHTTAAEVVRAHPGWLIAPATQFIGREGRVAARTWLHDGSERHIYSLAAYRPLAPGERPAPCLYRHIVAPTPGGSRHDFLVKTWDAGAVRLAVRNGGPEAWTCVVTTPLGRTASEVDPRGTVTLEIALAAESVSQVLIQLIRRDTTGTPGTPPELDLAP